MHHLYIAEDKAVLKEHISNRSMYTNFFVEHPLSRANIRMLQNGGKYGRTCAVIATAAEVDELSDAAASNLVLQMSVCAYQEMREAVNQSISKFLKCA